MGVPNFYSWLKKRYPLCVYDFNTNHAHQTDFLYMDMNQVIYKCAMQPNVLFRDQIAEKRFSEVWVSIFNYIDRVISLVMPRKLIFLTFDGVAPRAKMNQQRQRRFQSAKRAAKIDLILKQIGEIDRNETFKNNQISPGTEFMFELNQQVKFYISRKIHEDPKWKNVKIIFSGSDVPGEGEHKILEFIRNTMTEASFDPLWTHMIYGADADLIMLGLLTQLKNISIVREIMKTTQEVSSATQRSLTETDFQLINLSMVREYIDLEYRDLAPSMKISFDVNRLIDDFILICFFIGNDFLPRVFCFDIRQGTLEDLLTLFKNHMLDANDYLTNRGQINWTEFTRFMKRLTNFEIVALENRETEIKEYFQLLKNDPSQYEDTQLKVLEELSLMQKLTQFYRKDENIDGRSYFYSSKCEFNLEQEQDLEKLQELIQKYIEGIQFVLFYYFKGVPSWGWYYPAYYAPLCSDMYLYLSHVLENKSMDQLYSFTKGQPYNPFKQLLCILSPTNAPLLPQAYRPLLTSLSSPLRTPLDYYPEEFDIDPYGTIWEHQFIAKIPFVTEELIDEVYNSINVKQMSKEIIQRNEHGKSYLYEKSQEWTTIKSTLTDIYSDYESQQSIKDFDIEDKNECEDLISKLNKKEQHQHEFQIPTLHLNLAHCSLVELKDRGRKCNKMMITHQQTNDNFVLKQVVDSAKKPNQQRVFAYCGYPIPRYCEILGIMDMKRLTFSFDYKAQEISSLQNNDYNPLCHITVFNKLKDGLQHSLKENAIDIHIMSFAIVRRYNLVLNDREGKLYQSRNNGIESIVPIEQIYQTQNIDLKDIDSTLKSIQIQNSNQAIVLYHKDQNLIGSLVQIISTTNDDVQVQLIRQPTNKKLKFTKEVIDTYSIGFVADECFTHINVLLYVLGKVQVYLDSQFDSYKDLVPAVDIGLNVIDRGKNKLVPELVRIHKADSSAKGVDKYAQFKYLEMSKECVNILGQYRQRCPNLFWFLERIQQRDKDLKNVPKIKVTDLFPRAKDANISLIELYIWLSKQPFSNYILSSSASSVIQAHKIKDIQEKIIQGDNKKQSQSQIFNVDSALLVPFSGNHFIPPFYSSHPPIHKLKDRVVCINAADFGLPNFGSYGTVVGILDASDEILIEVMWDEPQIGLTTLGSRCSLLRGSICRFIDVYNLTQDWTQVLLNRNQTSKNVWDYKTNLYLPEFEDKAINKNHQQSQQNDPFEVIKDMNKRYHQQKDEYFNSDNRDGHQDKQRQVLQKRVNDDSTNKIETTLQSFIQTQSNIIEFKDLVQIQSTMREICSTNSALTLDQVENTQQIQEKGNQIVQIETTTQLTIIQQSTEIVDSLVQNQQTKPNQVLVNRSEHGIVNQAFNNLLNQGIFQNLQVHEKQEARSLDEIEKQIEEGQPAIKQKKVLQRPKQQE